LKPVAPRCRCSIPCDREFGVGKGVKVKFQAIPRAQKRLQKRTTLMIRVFGPWLRSPVVGRYVQRLLKCYIYIYIYIYIYLFICLFSLYVIHIYILYIYTLWCPCPEWHGRYALAWANPGMPGMPRWHIKQPQQDHFTLHRGTHWQHKGIHVDEAGPENVPTNAELGVRAKDSQWITPGQLRHVEAAGCRLKQVNLSISSIQRQKALLFFCTRCRLIVWDRLIEPGYQHSICLCSYDWVYLCILYIYIYISVHCIFPFIMVIFPFNLLPSPHMYLGFGVHHGIRGRKNITKSW
jgi:hypothetical protein